jgi:hypothetical protein
MKSPSCILLLLVSALAVAEAEPPRILIIGDDIYRQPAQATAKELRDRVELVHAKVPTGAVLHTGLSTEVLDEMLGDGKWDLIHFNFGLGDLVYRAPGMDSIRVLPMDAGGVRVTSPAAYEANLRAIVARFRKTGAMLVWASTTPIRASASNIFAMGSEIEYNAVAAKVMAEENVPINDMYTQVRSLIDMTKPAGHGADPFFFDRKPLEPFIVQCIQQTLNLPDALEAAPPQEK